MSESYSTYEEGIDLGTAHSDPLKNFKSVEFDAAIADTRKRISGLVSQILDIISTDIPIFVLKTMKQAFIDDIDFADSKSDSELAGFKSRAKSLASSLVDYVRQEMAVDDIWMGPGALGYVPSERKNLDANTAVSAVFAKIVADMVGFMETEGISVPAAGVSYMTPMRFIDGKYLPGIIEKYWDSLGHLKYLTQLRNQAYARERMAYNAARWDLI